MVLAHSVKAVRGARWAIERIGGLSDNIVGVGPFGIGIDGVLAWIPFVGDAYSLGAGLLLVLLGLRARAPASALIAAAALVALRSAVDAVPIAGPAVVDLFRGHKMAADVLLKAIDRTLYIEGVEKPSDPDQARSRKQARAGGEYNRVVFLREPQASARGSRT
ncbi:MAG: DUF4112 domain-containing protein [Caulobacteraceae bacterium]|nr:DUF4112 domain-containing protein [Caulobacteraceae bacterium]